MRPKPAGLRRSHLNGKDRPQMAITMEGYYAMKMHVLVRIGRWLQNIDAAENEHRRFYAALF